MSSHGGLSHKAIAKDIREIEYGTAPGPGQVRQAYLRGINDHGQGIRVTCRLDRRKNPTDRKVTNEEKKHPNLERHTFHGE